jgi:hypothetical protein
MAEVPAPKPEETTESQKLQGTNKPVIEENKIAGEVLTAVRGNPDANTIRKVIEKVRGL